MKFKFEDLEVWQLGMELTDGVYELSEKYPKKERYVLSSQLISSVILIPLNIAEGNGRRTKKDFRRFIRNAIGSLLETDANLKIGIRRKYITKQNYESVDEIIKGLNNAQIKAPLQMVDLRPYIDDETLPQHPIKAIQEGFAKDIELIIGTNLEEWRLWRAFEPNFEKIDENAMKTRIKMIMSLWGEVIDVEDMINVYTKSREKINMSMSIHDIYDAFITDAIFRIGSLKFAEAQSRHQKNTYMYMFNFKNV